MEASTFSLKKPKNIRKRTIEEVKDESVKEVNDSTKNDSNVVEEARLNQLDQHFEADESKTLKVKVGPEKAELNTSDNFRQSIRFDYAPDLCKDFLETGFCGFGDSCKFVHDRGDYKMGWELEEEWEGEKERRRQEEEAKILGIREENQKKEIEEIIACGICEKEFGSGKFVETKCKHRYCEKCALSHDRKSKKCFKCQEPVNGQFTFGRLKKN